MSRKIAPEELKTGMYVFGIERASSNMDFFSNSFLIKDEATLSKFREFCEGCRSVYVAECEVSAPTIIKAAVATTPLIKPEQTDGGTINFEGALTIPAGCVGDIDFQDELERAREIRKLAESALKDFYNRIKLGDRPAIEQLSLTVNEMIGSVLRNRDALTSLAAIKSYDDYTFSHSINTGILSISIGRHMGLGRNELHDLGIGALLHDIGKVFIPDGILNKVGKLTEKEYFLLMEHTDLGLKAITGAEGIRDDSRRVLTEHHERYDGKGYPQRLATDEIHAYARITAVADVYDALTTERPYKKALLQCHALNEMYRMRGRQFDPDAVDRLIKCLGVYPIGSFVELCSGEVAIVKLINHGEPLKPRVVKLLDRTRRPFAEPAVIDLAATGSTVVKYLNPESLNINWDLTNNTWGGARG